MSNSTNSKRRFIDILPISSGSDKPIFCDFCVGSSQATYLIYCLNPDNSHALNYGCDCCAAGWREIKNGNNNDVV